MRTRAAPFPPEPSSVYFLKRAADRAWKFCSLLRVGSEGRVRGRPVRQGSSLNRAAAFYRVAGIAPDLDPPARRS
jgi:hypothetical protein